MPLTLSEFKEHLGDVTFPLAVAVSGGADSMALLLLAHEMAQERGSHVVALTVNHNLRAEANAEALQVKNWANARGIEHEILDWDHDHPTARLQEKARNARYDLLIKWCKEHQISTVLLGHHQQDQEETFWLRFAAGSGLDGLTGMKKGVVKDGILFLRPFLNVPKERIQETLRSQNQDWIEDPSNQNPRFFRGRLRQFLQEEGLSSSRLHQTMNKFQRDADFIQDSLQKAVEKVVQMHEGGYLTLNKEAFQMLHPALAERLLSVVAQWYGDRPYAPRGSQILAVMDKINQGRPFTMGGIYWMMAPEAILLFRERRAVKDVLSLDHLDEPTLWDHRFWVDPGLKDAFPSGTTIQALEPVVLNSSFDFAASQLSLEARTEKVDMSLLFDLSLSTVRPERRHGVPKSKDRTVGDTHTIPKRAWPTLPALWINGKIVAVPHLCYNILSDEKDLRNFFSLKPLFHNSLRISI